MRGNIYFDRALSVHSNVFFSYRIINAPFLQVLDHFTDHFDEVESEDDARKFSSVLSVLRDGFKAILDGFVVERIIDLAFSWTALLSATPNDFGETDDVGMTQVDYPFKFVVAQGNIYDGFEHEKG
jgi:hypothetical protein